MASGLKNKPDPCKLAVFFPDSCLLLFKSDHPAPVAVIFSLTPSTENLSNYAHASHNLGWMTKMLAQFLIVVIVMISAALVSPTIKIYMLYFSLLCIRQ